MKRIIVICLMLVAGSAYAEKRLASAASRDDAGKAQVAPAIEAAKQFVADRLKDPESARFRDVFVSKKNEVICGEVNSKNSYGGYVGFQKFMIEEQRIYFADDGPSFPGMIDMACQK